MEANVVESMASEGRAGSDERMQAMASMYGTARPSLAPLLPLPLLP